MVARVLLLAALGQLARSSLRGTVSRTSRSCAVFGKGGVGKYDNCWQQDQLQLSPSVHQLTFFPLSGMFTWAADLPQGGVAMCNEEKSELTIWSGGQNFTNIALAPLIAPVGAVYLDGKIYVACFGLGPGTSGLAVVDPVTGTLEHAHVYNGDNAWDSPHLHNVYAFTWGGNVEIVAADLGNPWSGPPLAGKGLVLWDRNQSKFKPLMTGSDLNVRSAVQQSDSVFYALTQEPWGSPTRLARLVARGGTLSIEAIVKLPERSGGDGGADVLLGREPDTVFCTDRTHGDGRLYYYTFQSGSFNLSYTRRTGNHPRYTTMLPDGDIVSCNRGDSTLTVFKKLALCPTCDDVSQTTMDTLPGVSFFALT